MLYIGSTWVRKYCTLFPIKWIPRIPQITNLLCNKTVLIFYRPQTKFVYRVGGCISQHTMGRGCLPLDPGGVCIWVWRGVCIWVLHLGPGGCLPLGLGGVHPLGRHSPGRHPLNGHWSGQYASSWNAFLFNKVIAT